MSTDAPHGSLREHGMNVDDVNAASGSHGVRLFQARGRPPLSRPEIIQTGTGDQHLHQAVARRV